VGDLPKLSINVLQAIRLRADKAEEMGVNERMKVSANLCGSVACQSRQSFSSASRPDFDRVPQQGLAGGCRKYIETPKINIRRVAEPHTAGCLRVQSQFPFPGSEEPRKEAGTVNARAAGEQCTQRHVSAFEGCGSPDIFCQLDENAMPVINRDGIPR